MRAVACFSLLPFSVASYSPVRFRVNIRARSLCRAAGVLESQESGGRARPSCSQRCRRQAELEALGSGDAMAASSRAPTPTWLGLALLLLDAASAPLLSACAALQYRRCSPAASATRRFDQVPVEPGTSATSSTTALLGRTPASFSLATGRSPVDSSGVVAPRQRQGLLSSFVRGQNDFQASSVLRTQGVRCSGGHALAAKVAVVSASSSTCWLEFFDRRSFFSAPPATAVHRLLNLRVDVGLEPVEPAPQVLLPLVRLHIGLLASCQFHPAEASSHWLTLPRGGLGF